VVPFVAPAGFRLEINPPAQARYAVPVDDGELRVRAPKVPAQAVPGIYMLFVVDRNGVPSVGTRVDLKPETRGRHEGDHDDDDE